MEVRADDGRWRKQDGMSDVGQRADDDPNIYGEEDDPNEPRFCIICDAPAVRMAVVNSWRATDGEPTVFMVRVCQLHRGQWWWIPDDIQHAWDASTQRSRN